jgi:hypothetical protein
VIPASLWGRAEGLQTAVRTIGLALAPVAFGFVADVLGSTGAHSFGQGSFGSGSSAALGLQLTFLIMLVPVGLAGAILLLARRTYASDAAAASSPNGAGVAGEPARAPRSAAAPPSLSSS